MGGLNRYVIKQLLIGLAFVTGALTCVIWLIQSLRFVEMIVNRGLTVTDFLYLTVLLLPNFLTIILPIAFFMVVLFVYNRLIQDRELVVMRSAGMSQLALAKPALLTGLLVMGVIYLLNLWLLPTSYTAFRDMKWEMRSSFHILLREGTFNEIGPHTTVYVRERKSDGQLLGIFVHDERDPAKPYTLMAERGGLVQTEDAARVVMFNGNRQEVDKETNQLSILYFDRYTHDLSAGNGGPTARNRGGRERTLSELLNAPNDPNVQEHEIPRLTIEAHRRIITPVSIIGFALIALASLLYGGVARRNKGHRILTAVVAFVGLNALGLGVENLASKNLSWLPGIYFTALLPIPIAFWVMVRPPRVRRGSTPIQPVGV